jgi:hypothetical protein
MSSPFHGLRSPISLLRSPMTSRVRKLVGPVKALHDLSSRNTIAARKMTIKNELVPGWQVHKGCVLSVIALALAAGTSELTLFLVARAQLLLQSHDAASSDVELLSALERSDLGPYFKAKEQKQEIITFFRTLVTAETANHRRAIMDAQKDKQAGVLSESLKVVITKRVMMQLIGDAKFK